MKVNPQTHRRPRIEMLPLIDMVFLLLVFFIYAMLSMAVHRGLDVLLPRSSAAKIDKHLKISVSIDEKGTIYLDKEKIPLRDFKKALIQKAGQNHETAVLLFAHRNLSYQAMFRVLDQIRMAGLARISLQAEADEVQ